MGGQKGRITYDCILLRRPKPIASFMYAVDVVVTAAEQGHVDDVEALGAPLLGDFFGEVFGFAGEEDVVGFGDVEGVEEGRILVVEPGRVEAGHGLAGGDRPGGE